MTDRYSEDDVVRTVTRLTRSQLVRFIEDRFVQPEQGEEGYVFHRVDIARLEFLCDMSLDLDLDETALGIVVSLVDQLHAARQELAVLASAIETLPADLRVRITTHLSER